MEKSADKLLKGIEARILNNESTWNWLEENKVIDFKGSKAINSILYTLSSKWSKLSKEEQEEVGLNIAGTYNLARFYIFMGNNNFQ